MTEGLSKGRLRRLYPDAALSAERGHVGRLLRDSIPRLLVGGMASRDRRSVLGAGAILLALAVTGAAFLVGLTTAGRPSARH